MRATAGSADFDRSTARMLTRGTCAGQKLSKEEAEKLLQQQKSGSQAPTEEKPAKASNAETKKTK